MLYLVVVINLLLNITQTEIVSQTEKTEIQQSGDYVILLDTQLWFFQYNISPPPSFIADGLSLPTVFIIFLM